MSHHAIGTYLARGQLARHLAGSLAVSDARGRGSEDGEEIGPPRPSAPSKTEDLTIVFLEGQPVAMGGDRAPAAMTMALPIERANSLCRPR